MKEKVEVQLQAEKDNSDLQKQVKCLEMEVEEQVSKAIELEDAHRAESSDLRQQIQALEKQLENNRKFLDVRTTFFSMIFLHPSIYFFFFYVTEIK